MRLTAYQKLGKATSITITSINLLTLAYALSCFLLTYNFVLLSPFRYRRLNLFRSYQSASLHLLVLHKLTTVPVLPVSGTAIEDCTSSDVPTSFYFKWPCLRAHSFDASSFARITASLDYPVKFFASNRSLLFLKRRSYRRVIIQVKLLSGGCGRLQKA